MKDSLIMVSAYCDNFEKEQLLRKLVNNLQDIRNKFDIMVVSHSVIPTDISALTDYSFYDEKNEILTDIEYLIKDLPWYKMGNQIIRSYFINRRFNPQIAIWRMIIIGNSISKNIGYNKIHHIEYDTIVSFSEIIDNDELLNNFDSVVYGISNDSLLGSYQSWRLDNLSQKLLILNEEQLKNDIKKRNITPEKFLFEILSENNIYKKNISDLNKNDNKIDLSSKYGFNNYLWAVPFYDKTTDNIDFFIKNFSDYVENYKIIYNGIYIKNYNINPATWKIFTLGKFKEIKTIDVFVDDVLLMKYNIDDYGEDFKKLSFNDKT